MNSAGSRAITTIIVVATLGMPISVTASPPEDSRPTVLADRDIVLGSVQAITPSMAQRGVIRARTIQLPSDIFSEPPGDLPEPVSIPITKDRTVNLVEQRRRTTSDGKTIVIGVDQDQPNSRFMMLLKDNVLRRGEIRLSNEVIHLTGPRPTNGDLVFRLLAIDPRALPDERAPVDPMLEPSSTGSGSEPTGYDKTIKPEAPEQGPAKEGGAPDAASDVPGEVKVLVVYTPKASTASFNFWDEPIQDTIEFYVDFASDGLKLQTGITLNLVHMQQVPYTETSDILEDLTRLACPCDHKIGGVGSNNLNEVFDPWKEYEADIVSLWIDSPAGEAGIAYQMANVTTDFARVAVSVVDWSAASLGGMSFNHEIGHSFGARHDRAQEADEWLPPNYNYGFINPVEKEATMMAYKSTCDSFGFGCARTHLWSDPTYLPVDTWGIAAGPFAADNARSLSENASTIASFNNKHNLVGCCINTGSFWNRKWRPGPCP